MAAIQPTQLSSLRDSVRELANMEESEFVSDTELNRWINLGLSELYGLLLASLGEDYFITQATQALVANTDSYALPADFLKLRGVDLVLSGVAPGSYVELQRINFADRNRLQAGPVAWGGSAISSLARPAYYLLGSNIVFLPVPGAAATVRLTYVPRAPVLAADTDTWDGYNGWEEFAILYAAIRALQKEESDASVHLAQLEAFKVRVANEAHARDTAQPMRVVDAGGWGDW